VILVILGTILGIHGLNILDRTPPVQLLEKIGLLYIMLLAGMQINLANLQQVGIRALIFGGLTFGVPFLGGIAFGLGLNYALTTALLLGILFSPHTLVSYPIVLRLGILSQESVSVAIGGTVVTSVLTLVGLSLIQATAGGDLSAVFWIKIGLGLPLLTIVSGWAIQKLGERFLQPETLPLGQQFIFVLACLFVVASGTLMLGIDSIVGAFIAGLSLNRSIRPNLGLLERVEFVGSHLFIPLFLISMGLLCNPKVLIENPQNLGLALGVTGAAVGAKFLAAWIGGRLFNYQLPEVLTMGGLTISRAALVLVIALYGNQKGILPGTVDTPILSEGLFNAIVLYILFTCLMGPLVTDRFGRKLVNPNDGSENLTPTLS